MDGVLCDFKKRYKEITQTCESTFNKENFELFIDKGGFMEVEKLPKTNDLLTVLNELQEIYSNVNIEILSSLGNTKQLDKCAQQKADWLIMNGIGWGGNFVQHKGYKKDFASPKSILIDDTEINCIEFTDNSGFGILYDDSNFDLIVQKLFGLVEIINDIDRSSIYGNFNTDDQSRQELKDFLLHRFDMGD
jgi:hypothetical protein